jgi:CubicO group peptidase (beta-lactamase class C family)
MQALLQVSTWPVGVSTAAVVRPGQVVASAGDIHTRLRWASITKLATALAVMVAVEDGTIRLDTPAGPPGATVRHLLAHASGLPFEGQTPVSPPGRRRVYSNTGYVILAELLESVTGIGFETYLSEAVLQPLGLAATRLEGSAAAGLVGPCRDLAAFAQELLAPTLVAGPTFAAMTTVAFEGLGGILPGVGRMEPNDWGLGFELRDAKSPHWTGTRNSPGTFGHFGGSGSFLWVDPALGAACVSLSDREFGPWALQAWPVVSDAVIEELSGGLPA